MRISDWSSDVCSSDLSSLQPVRGTRDILPDEMRRHRAVVETARAVAARYGYHEMATPVFEFTEVFKRTLGETSDVVTKEMYTFAIGEGEQVTLRPEATAGVARAPTPGDRTSVGEGTSVAVPVDPGGTA